MITIVTGYNITKLYNKYSKNRNFDGYHNSHSICKQVSNEFLFLMKGNYIVFTNNDFVVNQIIIEMMRNNIPYTDFSLHFHDENEQLQITSLNERYDLKQWFKGMFDIVEVQFAEIMQLKKLL